MDNAFVGSMTENLGDLVAWLAEDSSRLRWRDSCTILGRSRFPSGRQIDTTLPRLKLILRLRDPDRQQAAAFLADGLGRTCVQDAGFRRRCAALPIHRRRPRIDFSGDRKVFRSVPWRKSCPAPRRRDPGAMIVGCPCEVAIFAASNLLAMPPFAVGSGVVLGHCHDRIVDRRRPTRFAGWPGPMGGPSYKPSISDRMISSASLEQAGHLSGQPIVVTERGHQFGNGTESFSLMIGDRAVTVNLRQCVADVQIAAAAAQVGGGQQDLSGVPAHCLAKADS